ncbi:MAG: glycosyltransferase [Bacteroidota bacterium]
MAKILIVTSGLTGIFNAVKQLVSILEEGGHVVTSASPRQDIDVKDLGFSHIVLNPLSQSPIVRIPLDKHKKGISTLLYKHLIRGKRRSQALEVIEPLDFLPLVQSLSPDMILIDIEMHEYIFQAHSTGIPVVLLNQFFSVWTSASLPDIQSNTVPGIGFTGSKPGLWLSFVRLLAKRNYRAARMSLLSGGVSRIEILHQLAKKFDFPRDAIGYNLWPGPIVYNKLKVLNMTLEALEWPHAKRPMMRYIGPMVNLDRNDPKAQTTNDYTLEAVFEKAEQSGAKIVYCAVGTMKTGKSDFLKNLVEGMGALSSWILVLSVGKHIDEAAYRGDRTNVFTFSHVPQLEVLSKASVAIVHGGIHTIHECLLLKVPMLIYSGKKADQNGNAARLVYHGLAHHGDRHTDTKKDIIRKIERLAQDQKIKDAMDELCTELKHRSGEDVVKEILGGEVD